MSDVPQYEQDDGALTKDQLDQIAADQTPLDDWYIVEKWVDGERRGTVRRGESIEAVLNEECARGTDVINVILV